MIQKEEHKAREKRERRAFDRAYKAEAVHMVIEQGLRITRVARKLNIHPNMLSRWKHEYMKNKNTTSSGKELEKLKEEVMELRREVIGLQEEKEVLKKALIILSRGKKI